MAESDGAEDVMGHYPRGRGSVDTGAEPIAAGPVTEAHDGPGTDIAGGRFGVSAAAVRAISRLFRTA